ncbi:MAG TPA: hypothetical protein VLM11_19490 [Streptosporangiaceae bacterium]|nr:hypothetical protein [Streptosporangiaceae bacterium]
MTRRTNTDTVVSRIRWSGALAAAAALTALVAMGPPGEARAATGTGYDQITGKGTTNSALTVNWAQGLLDNTNKPIAAANADRSSATPTSPLSFMYPDFKNLQVTVSQTQDITHQGITIIWKGGIPTVDNSGGPGANYLQLMECYGDASTGPSPQGCEYGSAGLLGPKASNSSIGTREGDICVAGAQPSTTNPPGSLNGDGPVLGCDPGEPGNANPPDVVQGDNQDYSIPFVPVNDPTHPAYGNIQTAQYFDEFTSNEVQESVTSADGTGQLQFETLTSIEAPGLGCGDLESNGQTRNCWLVIVPRGQYEPNGYKIDPSSISAGGLLWSSPLSASNWAMRIQIHLAYAPIGSFCPIGTQEIQTIGTQIVARAVQSWQLALNKAAKCNTVYGYSAVPEATSTQQLALPGSPAGLAFTTIPIGSEVARPGGSGGSIPLPPILYAPVAVSAVGFGFNINEGTGFISTPVKLTPELLAKGITQVYLTDLPDYYPNGTGFPGPSWAQSNPVNVTKDPQFQNLNPAVPALAPLSSEAPLLTEDHSALNQQVWQWIQADPAASAWLNSGTNSAANSVTADPDYTGLKLGTPPAIDSFPRAYSGVLDLGQSASGEEETRLSLDLLPYVNSYDQAASSVLTANNPTTGAWDDQILSPSGKTGWWDKNGAEPLGHIFIWGISDTADLAAYGLVDAQMCDNSGANCVVPSVASITTALNSAKPDSAGLLQVNPASPGAGGYPLVQVTYAAVDTARSAADLTAYANLIAYAGGTGQTAGVAPGDLPPGYLPLTASLKAQAASVVATLRADAKGSTSPSPSPAPSSAPTGSTAPTTTGGSASASSGQLTPTVSSSTATTGLSILPAPAQLTSSRTARQPLGGIRWALLVVVMAGAACAAGGTALRSASVARWLRRLRT